MKKIIRFWMPVVLWMAVIFSFSSRQKIAVTDSYALSFVFFKTLHILEYAFLYVISYRAFRNTSKKNAHRKAFFLTAIYAVTDEIHQLFVPTREGRFRDVIIDWFGGGIGWFLIDQLLRKMPKILKNLGKKWQII